jgi:hypothetical protein
MSLADHPVAGLGHLDPGSGQVPDRLGDNQPGVVGDPLEDLAFGIQLPEQADVAGEEQRPRLPLAGVAEHPQPLAVDRRDRALERVLDAARPPACLDEPDGAATASGGSSSSPKVSAR